MERKTVFVEAGVKIHTYTPDDMLQTWFFCVATNSYLAPFQSMKKIHEDERPLDLRRMNCAQLGPAALVLELTQKIVLWLG